MRASLRWPLLPVLLIGVANILAWHAVNAYWVCWSGADVAIGIALVAGWYARENFWGVVLLMLVPTMFIGVGTLARGKWTRRSQ